MIKKFLDKLFNRNKEVPETEQFYTPLRIALHSTVTVDMVDYITMFGSLNKGMKMPVSSMDVNAIGTSKVSKTETIFNIYLEDTSANQYILQLFYTTRASGKMVINEATLYHEVINIVPLTDVEWSVNMDKLTSGTIEVNGDAYTRVWGHISGMIDLVDFNETVVSSFDTIEYNNHYMLFNRKINNPAGDVVTELMLAGVEETAETAEVTMMVGLSVSPHNINVQ